MNAVRFAKSDYVSLVSELLADNSRESCGVAFASHGPVANTWIVRDTLIAPDAAYEQRDATSAILRPGFLVDIANRARPTGESVVLIHTHPWAAGIPLFSPTDDVGEVSLAEYFERRVSHGKHLALVVGPDGCRARVLGSSDEIPVWEVGGSLKALSDHLPSSQRDDRFERQVRAFGALGQQLIGALRVGVVGLGGTGSVTVQQLVHLGVRDFVLVDPDCIELTNLNRLAGAGIGDIGSAKVKIAERMICMVDRAARVRSLKGDIVDAATAGELKGLDFIFLCTDSHASRSVVGQLAYQYLIPTIDMGVSITARDGQISHITGRVQMLAPGLPCLTCTGALDGEQIRREMLTPEQRAADPYVLGAHEPHPAVMSINSAIASLAVTMFLGAVTPIPAGARFQLYDGVRGTVRPTMAQIVPDCIVCSKSGALARGDSWSLPVRPQVGDHG